MMRIRSKRFTHYILLVALLLTTAVSAFATDTPDQSQLLKSLAQRTTQELMDSGRINFEQRLPAKALACFMTVSERLRHSDDEADINLRIRALNNSACVYKYFYFDYIQAYDLFIEAYDLCKATGHDDVLPVVMVNLGDLLNDYSMSYNSESLARQAQDIFAQCMEHARKSNNWELMTTAFFNMANQNYDLKLEKYRFIFSENIPDSTPDLKYIRLQYEGLQHVQQKRYTEARKCFLQQLQHISARWERERDTLASYMSIAYTYRMEKDFVNESDYLKRALLMADDINIGDQAIGICKLLADSYKAQQAPAEAQRYYQLYLEKKEEAQNSKLANIGELNYIHELKQEQKRAEELFNRQRFQQIIILAGIMVLIVVAGSAILLWRKNRQLHARNKSLYDKSQQLLQMERTEQTLRKEYEELAQTKYSRSSLSDEQKSSLESRIQELLNNSETIYEQDFTLNRLAKLADSNTTYVSQVVNECYGMPFSNVLAGLRIKEACRRISDPSTQYSQMTIEAIATSVGFKSRTSFINAFKREVGLTPSEYLRMARDTNIGS